MYPLSGFEGKVAVVTGAGRMRSIGRAIAVELAKAGCAVAVTGSGRPREKYPPDEQAAGWRDIESVAEEIRQLGGQALPVVSDVADPAQVDGLLAAVLDAFGRVDIVVNNAAAARGPDRLPVLDLDVETWDRVVAVNLRGPFLMTRAFGRRLVEQGDGGVFVNISSIGGKLSGAGSAAYSASKAALQSLTSSTAKELGQHGIRVNALCPGVVGTSRLDDVDPASWAEYVRAQVPLRQVGEPADIAAAAVFLASAEAGWVTGQCWNVDGGQLTIR